MNNNEIMKELDSALSVLCRIRNAWIDVFENSQDILIQLGYKRQSEPMNCVINMGIEGTFSIGVIEKQIIDIKKLLEGEIYKSLNELYKSEIVI